MLKKSFILCLLLLGFSATPWAQGGGMSDKQVMEYVEMGMKQGKSQQQIATELARRGVTREQAERVRKLYTQSNKNGKNSTTQPIDRNRKQNDQELNSNKEYIGRDFQFDNGNESQTGTANTRVYKYVTTQELDLAGKDSLSFSLDKNG